MNRSSSACFVALAVCLSSSSCGMGVDDASTSSSAVVSDCSDTWAGYGETFFANTCRTCHEHTSQFATHAYVQATRSSITREVSSGAMPEGTALSATDKARILAYLSCGAR